MGGGEGDDDERGFGVWVNRCFVCSFEDMACSG